MRIAGLAAWTCTVWSACAAPSKTDTARPLLPSPDDSAVLQNPPTGPAVSIVPAEPLTADPLSWTVDRPPTDPDGDPLTWSVMWSVDGVEQPQFSDTVPADATALGQVWELRVAVSDGTFASDTALAVAVIGNTAPVASVVITPEAPTTVDRLRAIPSGTDVDGDAFGYEILWLVNGSNSGLTGPDVPAERTTAGESWSVVVTPYQAGEMGVEASATARIRNSSPVVTALDIQPRRPGTNDSLTAEFEAEDADPGDTLVPRFSWTVDGIEVGTTAELASSLFVRGQEVGLSVAMNDGTVTGPARYADAVTIENTAPSITQVAIVPVAPGPTDVAHCVPTGWDDADGDAAAYEFAWTLAGAIGPTTASWDLSTAAAVAGDSLGCAATPVDGWDTGATLSAVDTVSEGA